MRDFPLPPRTTLNRFYRSSLPFILPPSPAPAYFFFLPLIRFRLPFIVRKLTRIALKRLQAPPKYTYKYGVKDPHTKDDKGQWEEREGDVVHGGYSIAQPDGRIRKVTYTADKHNGFNALVHYEHSHAYHPQHYGHHHHGGR